MFEILCVLLFAFLLIKVVKLAFKMTWGVAKILALVLIVLALPALIGGLLAGGLLLAVPLILIAVAFAILKIIF